MSKIPESVLHQLEFHEIRQILANNAEHPKSKAFFTELNTLSSYKALQTILNKLQEYTKAITEIGHFPSPPIVLMEAHCKVLETEGRILELESIIDIKQSIFYLQQWDNHTSDFYSQMPILVAERDAVENLSPVLTLINKVFDENNEIYSHASERLKQIRKRLTELDKILDREFKKALKAAGGKNQLAETQESHLYGRRVLSVLVEEKRKTQGAIVGYSRNGNIAYLEPENTIALNDERDKLQNEERAEILKILRELSKQIRPFKDNLASLGNFMVEMEILHGKYRLAKSMQAVLPNIDKSAQQLDLINAYHPLLLLKNQADGLQIKPNNISLNSDARILVISGPNAGGKSIAMKTVGLCSVMALSGLFIPVQKNSTIAFYNKIFTDIGDNQSIEDELSTYSHKLKAMANMLRYADEKSLVLIDEFGTGSDPKLGGAIAEVFLEDLYKKGCQSILTTHYNNIKTKADQLPAASNASMEFDRSNLKPLYKLNTGVAGQSFTFEVAENSGFPKKLINKAKGYAGKEKMNFEQSLQNVELERQSLRQLKNKLADMEQKLQEKEDQLDIKNKLLLKKAESESYLDLNEEKWLRLGKQTENWLKKLPVEKQKQVNHGDKMLKALREIRQEYLQSNSSESKKKVKVKKQVAKGEIPDEVLKVKQVPKLVKEGARVRLMDSNTTGIVTKIEGKKAEVQFGNLKSMIKLELLTAI